MADEVKDEKKEQEEEAAEQKTDQDEFDEAFDEAVTDPEAGETETKEEKKEEEPAEKKEEEEEEASQEEIDWKARAETLEGENQAAVQKMKSWEGRISAANKRAEEAERKLQERDSTQAKGDEALPGGEDDDDKVLKDFIDEFPSLEKPIKALAKRIASKIVDDKIKDIEPKLQKIEPLEKRLAEDEVEAHFDSITEAHSDWKEIRDSGKLKVWIDAQPSFVKNSLERVVTEGSTKEVIEMFDTYKTSINSTKPSTTPRGKVSNKKAQDLLAVESGPSGTPKGKIKQDKDDFDAGWDEALSRD